MRAISASVAAFICLAGILFFAPVALAASASPVVTQTYRFGDFKLYFETAAADLCYSPDDYKVVEIAVNCFADDVQRVTARKPAIKTDLATLGQQAVLIGTLGKSPLIDRLIAAGKIDPKPIQGQWESYLITIVANPLPGVQSGLVIVGADRRGTAYGLFELSTQIGVSPWCWWADVPTPHQDTLVVAAGTTSHGPPSVKYRGIFLNDEDWGLQPWSAKTVEPKATGGVGDVGPKTYARIFELLLRLKANFCWPAMHDVTKAFNIYPENKVVADNYAIVMGSSHCEPMLRNNVSEWTDPQGRVGQAAAGSFNYVTNRTGILDYWRDGLQQTGKFENVYTLGIRGIHDGDMAGGGTVPEKAARLNQVITDERDLIKQLVNPNVSQVPQIFCPYKEVLTYYQNGAVPPDDVTLVWADDNHGYIRQLSTPAEQKRPGGGGVYYHISYWGRPHDYLWLETTPPALIWEELSKAYDYGDRNLWVVNVGDLKPAEIALNFAMTYAYDTSSYTLANLGKYLTDFSARTFGLGHATEIAAILDEYYHLNYQRKPEHLGFNTSQNPGGPIQRTEFNPYEINDRLRRFAALVATTDALYAALPADQKDAFYQLVVYPVRGSAAMNRKILFNDLNHLAAGFGFAQFTDQYAAQSSAAHEEIQAETDYFNNTLANGKWKYMMSAIPHNQDVFRLPSFLKAAAIKYATFLAVIPEGEGKPIVAAVGRAFSLPTFNPLTRTRHCVDLFNTGTQSIDWSVTSTEPGIRFSATSGSIDTYTRLWIDVDYSKVPPPSSQSGIEAHITLSSPGNTPIRFDTKLLGRPADLPADYQGFAEDSGYVAMSAEHFTRNLPRNNAAWTIIPGLGRIANSVAVFPTTTPSHPDPATLSTTTPELQYDFYTFTPSSSASSARITVQAIPTHRINPERGLRYAIAVDGETPQIMDLETPENSAIWSTNVLRASAYGTTSHNLPAGRHTLHIYMVDPGVVLDQLTIDLGGLPRSYLPPAETRTP